LHSRPLHYRAPPKAEVEGPRQDHNVWEDLKKNLLGKIDAFEESLVESCSPGYQEKLKRRDK
jgi:hypothetical protein